MKLVFNLTGTVESVEEVAPPRLVFTIYYNNLTIKDPKMLVLPNDHKVTASIQPIDGKGNPAAIDGEPTWTSSSPSIAAVTPNPSDGSGIWTAVITPADQLGTCQINVSADADLGQGTTAITGVLDLQVVAGSAVGFRIETAPPEPVTAAKTQKK